MITKKILSVLLLAASISAAGLLHANYDEACFEELYKEMMLGYDLAMPSMEGSRTAGANPFNTQATNNSPVSFNPGLQMKILLDNCFIPSHDQEPSHLDSTTWSALQIVRGTNRPEDSLVNRLTKIEDHSDSSQGLFTLIGKKRFSEILAMPSTNVAKLQARQNCIRAIQKNSNWHDAFIDQLEIMKENEQYYIDFCTKNSIEQAGLKTIMPWMVSGNSITTLKRENASFYALGAIATLFFGATALTSWPKKTDSSQPSSSSSFTSLFTLASLASIGGTYAYHHKNSSYFATMNKNIQHVAEYINAQRAILNLFSQLPALYQNMPEYKIALDILDGKDINSSTEFKQLNEYFANNSNSDSWAATFMMYKYLCTPEIRKEFSYVFDIIGEIDGYVALASKMNAHKDMPNAQFCFVDFIKKSTKPILNVKNFWNPFIKTADAVANSVLLNAGAERSMIITGPNTGGKSTTMKGLIISILTAQAFGIAPAEKMMFTPFTNILTYLNIGDDTGAGKSKFRAELDRAEKLMFSLKSLPSHDFGFVILDEIFTGTGSEQGEAFACKFIKSIHANQNVIFVSATHLEKLKNLETETDGCIKNYQMDVHVDGAGRISKYTYQIVPGASTVNSVLQVAREAGISF